MRATSLKTSPAGALYAEFRLVVTCGFMACNISTLRTGGLGPGRATIRRRRAAQAELKRQRCKTPTMRNADDKKRCLAEDDNNPLQSATSGRYLGEIKEPTHWPVLRTKRRGAARAAVRAPTNRDVSLAQQFIPTQPPRSRSSGCLLVCGRVIAPVSTSARRRNAVA